MRASWAPRTPIRSWAKELERVFGVHDPQTFRVESIRPVRYGLDIGTQFAHPCVYGRYGEQKSRRGFTATSSASVMSRR